MVVSFVVLPHASLVIARRGHGQDVESQRHHEPAGLEIMYEASHVVEEDRVGAHLLGALQQCDIVLHDEYDFDRESLVVLALVVELSFRKKAAAYAADAEEGRT